MCSAELAISHLVSNKRKWNNCFIKNNHEKLLNTADLVIISFLQMCTLNVFVERGIMAHIPWPLNQSKLWNWVI